MNRRLAYLEKVNPEVAQIRKKVSTNIEQGWEYIRLLLQKTNLENSDTEIWLNNKYHILEESQSLQAIDTRSIAGALVFIAGLYTGEEISKETIKQIMKPLTDDMLNTRINDLKSWLNLKN